MSRNTLTLLQRDFEGVMLCVYDYLQTILSNNGHCRRFALWQNLPFGTKMSFSDRALMVNEMKTMM